MEQQEKDPLLFATEEIRKSLTKLGWKQLTQLVINQVDDVENYKNFTDLLTKLRDKYGRNINDYYYPIDANKPSKASMSAEMMANIVRDYGLRVCITASFIAIKHQEAAKPATRKYKKRKNSDGRSKNVGLLKSIV